MIRAPTAFVKTATALAKIVGAAAILLGALVGVGIYMNDRAASAATSFCDKVMVGMEEPALLAVAATTTARHLQGSGKHHFRFQGWVFNAVTCEIRVEGGRVSGKALVVEED